jgi:predicted RNA methylase
VKAAGFAWAPKQDQFIASMWTPARADLCIELAGEIGDEDTSLIDRAEERADRFDDYHDKRTDEAERATAQARRVADGVPFGQPILVGHHSERHARKDAERIQNGMRKAVQAFDTADYWKRRAVAAIQHAKYKERPDVRARRIKTIEADKRKQERSRSESLAFLSQWDIEPMTMERATAIANQDYCSRCYPLADYPRDPPASQYEGHTSLWSALTDGIVNAGQARGLAREMHARVVAFSGRWIEHYENRLALRARHAGRRRRHDRRQDRAGEGWGGALLGRARHVGLHPEGQQDQRHPAGQLGQRRRQLHRTVPFDKLAGVMTAAQVEHERSAGLLVELANKTGFTLLAAPTDEDKDAASSQQAETDAQVVEPNELPTDIEAMRATVKAGVQVVSAQQLFPTPHALAARMVDLAGLAIGMRVLEPSAGTGRLLEALPGIVPFGLVRQTALQVVAVEVNSALAARLACSGLAGTVRCADFLQCSADVEDLGLFDAVLMNPPFAQGADIEHITHALKMLKPGGRLVALCANGPVRTPAFARWSRHAVANGRTCRPTPSRKRAQACGWHSSRCRFEEDLGPGRCAPGCMAIRSLRGAAPRARAPTPAACPLTGGGGRRVPTLIECTSGSGRAVPLAAPGRLRNQPLCDNVVQALEPPWTPP